MKNGYELPAACSAVLVLLAIWPVDAGAKPGRCSLLGWARLEVLLEDN
jgi:hypothetical protein